MKSHQFTITCHYVSDTEGHNPHVAPLTFDIGLRENVLGIMEKMKAKEKVPAEDVAPFALGLKLLGEVLRHNKDTELGKNLQPHFMEMMKIIKKS